MLLRAGVSISSLIRYKDALVQKYGGWTRYYLFQLSGTIRDLHGWQDLTQTDHLAVGATTGLSVITNGSIQNVTPQQFTTNPVPDISTVLNSSVVSITDPNVQNVTIYDAVFFNVPISIGGIILDGLYQITSITGTSSYTVDAGQNATSTVTNPSVTNAITPAGNNTLHFASTPAWVTANLLAYDLSSPTVIPVGTTVQSATASTVVLNNNVTGTGVGAADQITFASIPIFETIMGGSTVTVHLLAHHITTPGGSVFFAVSTTGNGVTISGNYIVLTVVDANQFTIQANAAATVSGSFPMNGGNLQLIYNIALGPSQPGAGYGLGQYGLGAYGFGTGSTSVQTGTPISATDWTFDNWGEILIACPENQGIYQFDPTGGFLNASIIPNAPPRTSGIFISTTQQILIAYGAAIEGDLGYVQNPLLVQWSAVGDYTNWAPSAANQAGDFVVPLGSRIMAGTAVGASNLILTDLDAWAMNYIGPPLVYGFTKIGAGAGAVSSHAVQQLRGGVYWMGQSNFYLYNGSNVAVIPCPVWDAVFQNLNQSFTHNIRAMPNTPFSEVGWLYPSAASTSGECDSYVKVNITEPNAPWDYGPLPRTAWIDQTVLGPPIGASTSGLIYQHETSPDADGAPLTASFTTGFFYIAEGEDFAYVDQILPDFKWGTFSGSPNAQIQLTFNVTNYPGDTPTSYGPYTVTQATQYVSVRFRGRLMSITVASADLGSFWRIGLIKYRFSPAGRR